MNQHTSIHTRANDYGEAVVITNGGWRTGIVWRYRQDPEGDETTTERVLALSFGWSPDPDDHLYRQVWQALDDLHPDAALGTRGPFNVAERVDMTGGRLGAFDG